MLEMLLQLWYTVGIFVAFFIAAAIAIYIFFDIRTLPSANNTRLTQGLYLIAALLTLPGILVRFTADSFRLLMESAVFSVPTIMLLLGLLGVLGSLAALLRYRLRDKPLAFQPPPYSAKAYDTATPATPIDLSTPPSIIRPISRSQPGSFSGSMPTVLDDAPTAPPAPAGWLQVTIVQGQTRQDSHRLEPWQPTILGRDPNNTTILLNDNTVSRRHAEIRYENGQFMLYDLNSTSGTYVNSNRIQSQALRHNDKIHLGRAEIIFHMS